MLEAAVAESTEACGRMNKYMEPGSPAVLSESEPQSQLPSFTDTSNSSMWLSDEEYREIDRKKCHRRVFQTFGAAVAWMAWLVICPKVGVSLLALLLYRFSVAADAISCPRILALRVKQFKSSDAWLPSFFAQLTEKLAALAHARAGEFSTAFFRSADEQMRLFCWQEGGNLERREAKLLEKYRKTRTAGVAAHLGHTLLQKGDVASSFAYSQEAIRLANRNSRVSGWFAMLNSARACTRMNELAESERILSELIAQLPNCTAIDSGEVSVALAELRFKQDRMEEAELHARNAYECFRGRYAEGTPIRVYAERLLALVLKCEGRVNESTELLFAADISEQLMFASNETQAEAYRSALRSQQELTLVGPSCPVVSADPSQSVRRVKADTPSWYIDLVFPFFVSSRTASLLARAGLLKHWRLYSLLRCWLVTFVVCWILSSELTVGAKAVLILIQGCFSWQMPNVFLAKYGNRLNERNQLKKF